MHGVSTKGQLTLTACQPIWVMLCRNELCQNLLKKCVKNITPSVDPNIDTHAVHSGGSSRRKICEWEK